MAQITGHPNVVSLIGVVTKGLPLMLLVSFCEKGSLLAVLREGAEFNRPVDVGTKIQVAIDIAKGMAHLSALSFVHRDLAARNCLLDSQYSCKVADFGLSRGTKALETNGQMEGGNLDNKENDYYRSKTGIFPVRWSAPEAMEELKFTSASDVWSFGVVLAEIFYDGRQPYAGCDNAAVMNMVMRGERLSQPPECPEYVYAVMLECWNSVSTSRPSFQLLASKLAATPGGRIAPSIGTTGSLGGSMPQLRRGTGGGGGGGGADATDANPQYILQATSEQGKSSQPIYNADDGQAIAAAAGAGGGGGGGDAAGAGGRAEDPYTTYTVPTNTGGGRAEDPYTTYTPATRGMDNGAYEHTPTTAEEDEHPYMQPTTPLDAADASGGSAPASTGDEHPYMQPTLPLRAAGIVAPEESNYLRTDEDTQNKTVIIAGLPTGPPPPRPKTAFVDPNIRVGGGAARAAAARAAAATAAAAAVAVGAAGAAAAAGVGYLDIGGADDSSTNRNEAQRLKARNASMATVVVVNGLFTVTLPQKSSGTRMVVLASAVPSEPSGGKIEIYDKKGKTSNTLPVKTIRVKNIQSVGKSINKKQETCLTVEDKSNPGNLFFFAPGKDANLVEELHTFISARHGSGGSSSITAFSNSETRL